MPPAISPIIVPTKYPIVYESLYVLLGVLKTKMIFGTLIIPLITINKPKTPRIFLKIVDNVFMQTLYYISIYLKSF